MITLPPEILESLERGDTVVAPSPQRAHALRIARARNALERRLGVWPTPDVLSSDAWIAREVARAATGTALPRALSAAEDWWLWREATARAMSGIALGGTAALADSLRRADRLASEHHIDIARWRAIGGRETQLLDEVRRAVVLARRERGADTVANIAAAMKELAGPQAVHFVGFATRDVPWLRSIHAARSASGHAGKWCVTGESRALPAVELAGDTSDEIERIAAWCLHRLERSANARLLVVAASGLEQREALAAQIRAALAPRSKLAGEASDGLVAIEGGVPLARQSLVQQSLASLTWFIDGLDFDEFSTWLRSPHGVLPAEAAARVDLWWRRHAPVEADARASLALLGRAAAGGLESAGTLVARLRAALGALDSGSATARVWAERFSGALAALRDSAEYVGLDSAGQQTWLRFVGLLDEFGAVAGVAGTLTARQALGGLRDLAMRTTYQPATGDALVTIAALHDDPIAHYDGIWVANLTSEAWPAPAMTNPFVPLVALRDAGVVAASGAGQLAVAQQALAAWRAATDHLVLSAATASGDLQVSPSPLLAAWPRRDTADNGAAGMWLPLRLRRPLALEVLADETGMPWPAQQSLPGGTSALQHQADCPFRAYAWQQLGAEPLDELRLGVEPDERGRWLHAALDVFWRRVMDSTRLAALAPEELRRLARQAVEQAREAPPLHGAQTVAASREREAQRLVQLIVEFAALEATRPAFRVAGIEQQKLINVGEARLAVRIDRVDALAEGGLAVIDYKSGKPQRHDWYGERPDAVQLLTYLAALGSDVRALANAHLTRSDMCYTGITAPDVSLPKVPALQAYNPESGAAAWERQVEIWLAQLRGLAAQFLRAEAAVTPARSACRYCHLGALCRVGERAQLEERDDADG